MEIIGEPLSGFLNYWQGALRAKVLGEKSHLVERLLESDRQFLLLLEKSLGSFA